MSDFFSLGGKGFNDLSELVAELSQTTKTFNAKYQKALEDSADIALKYIGRNFASSGSEFGDTWKPLHPLTQRDRKRRGYKPSRPILVRRGWLRASLTSKTSANAKREITRRGVRLWSTLKVKSGDNLFEIHQRGIGRVPARKMIKEGSPPWVNESAWKEIEARMLGLFIEIRRELM